MTDIIYLDSNWNIVDKGYAILAKITYDDGRVVFGVPTQVVQKQLPISDEDRNKLINVRIGIFDNDVNGLAEKLFIGDVTLGAWEEKMKQIIRELHSSVAAINKGGWDQMTWEDWGRLGPILKDQYKYLHQFAQKIATNRETISLRAIQAQARLYGQSSMKAELVTIPLPIEKLLPWMPRSGNGQIGMGKGEGTECRMNCCCGWVLKIIRRKGDWVYVDAIWTLSPSEHCETCVDRDGYTVHMRLHSSVEVPDTIGFYCEGKEFIEKGG